MEGRPMSLYMTSKRSLKRPNTSSLKRLTSRMGWFSGIRALTSIMATNCRCACFLPRMTVFTRSGYLIPDLFRVFHQPAKPRDHEGRFGLGVVIVDFVVRQRDVKGVGAGHKVGRDEMAPGGRVGTV